MSRRIKAANYEFGMDSPASPPEIPRESYPAGMIVTGICHGGEYVKFFVGIENVKCPKTNRNSFQLKLYAYTSTKGRIV